MSGLIFLLFASWCAFLNRGAGSQFWGKIPSTQISRIIFAVGIALPWGLLTGVNAWWIAAMALALYLWRLKGWGDFFASIHGRRTQWRTTGDAKWAVWLSDKIWNIDPKEGMETRLKATLDMAIRQALIIPVAIIAGNYLHACVFPLLGISYFLMGFLGEKGAVGRAELINGALIAAILWGW